MGIQERRQRERAARRQSVLDAARELVRERGFNGATTKQIAARCELSEATLFWYFKNKDEIFTSLLFDGIDFMKAGIEPLAARRLTPERKLSELWKFFGKVLLEHPEYFHVFAYLANPQACNAISDELKNELAARSGDNFRIFGTIIKEVAPGVNSRLVADLLWSSFVGLVLLRASRGNLGAKPHPTDRELSAAFKLLLSGLEGELAEEEV